MAWPCTTESLMRAFGHSTASASSPATEPNLTLTTIRPPVCWFVDFSDDLKAISSANTGTRCDNVSVNLSPEQDWSSSTCPESRDQSEDKSAMSSRQGSTDMIITIPIPIPIILFGYISNQYRLFGFISNKCWFHIKPIPIQIIGLSQLSVLV